MGESRLFRRGVSADGLPSFCAPGPTVLSEALGETEAHGLHFCPFSSLV